MFNYIHDLEFLVDKTQKERANYDLKFKKIVSHIRHGFTNNNIISDQLDRDLKLLTVMTPKDTSAHAKKDKAATDAKGDSQLRQLLGGSSKSANNSNPPSGSHPTSNGDMTPSTNDMVRGSIATLNVHTGVNWLKDSKRILGEPGFEDPSQLDTLNEISNKLSLQNGSKPKADQSHVDSQVSSNTKADNLSYQKIKLEWNQLYNVIAKESKRRSKQARKERELKLERSASQSIMTHVAFKNQAISNIESQMGEMCFQNTGNASKEKQPLTQNNMNKTGYSQNQPVNQAYPDANGYQVGYAHHSYDSQVANGYNDSKLANGQVGSNGNYSTSQLDVSKPLDAQLYSKDPIFDDATFLDFKKKGVKRSKKSKKAGQEEF